MGSYGDDRYGDDRWREREQNSDRDRDYGREGRERGRGGYRGSGSGGSDDRGFLNRAGDELRSWFGDDEAQRRREYDQRLWEQQHRMTGPRDNDGGPGTLGGGGFGGGWGNQRAESWNRDRPGERGGFGGPAGEPGGAERHYGRNEREGWFSDSRGGERGERPGGSSGQTLGGEGGGDYGGRHDPHYAEWRRRQIEDLDRDYEEYRREHQSKFEAEFGTWRSRRQSQRQSLERVSPQMEVVGSDGTHVGTVDKVRGDRLILTRSDPEAGGIHHSLPCSWVDSVGDKVTLSRSGEEAKREWRAEDRNPALFDRDGASGGPGAEAGPHYLNRSFSGTYDEGGRGPGERRND